MARRRPRADPLAQPLTTTQRGLGWDHVQQRRLLLRNTPDGWPCPLCGKPMYPQTNPAALDADHTVPRSLGGTIADRLTHRACNRSRGNGLRPPARKARDIPTQRAEQSAPITTRQW